MKRDEFYGNNFKCLNLIHKIFLAHTLLKRLRLKTNYYTRGVTMKTTQGLGILTSLVFVSCASASQAAVIDWSNVSGGDFNNGANWAGGSAPSTADTASFNTDVAGSYTASLSQDTDVDNVSVKNDDVVIDLNGRNLETMTGISVSGDKGATLTLRNGSFNQNGDEFGDLVEIMVDSASASESRLVLDGVDFGGRGMGSRMQLYVGYPPASGGTREGVLELKNKSGVTGQSAYIGGKLILSEGSSMGLAGELDLDGVLEITGGAGLGSSGAYISGKTLVDGRGSDLSVGEFGDFNGETTFQNGATGSGGRISTGGRFTVDGAGTEIRAIGSMDLGGNVVVSNSGSLVSSDLITVTGVMNLDNAQIEASSLMTEFAGRIQGAGDITGKVKNTDKGTVATGANGSSLNIDGNYTQEHGGTLELTLGDWDAIGDYKLNITGEADLDGILKIDLWDTFKPQLNDVFTLIKAENINGMFSDFVLPKLSPGLGWDWGSDMVAGMETFSLKVVKGVPEPYTIVLMTIGLAGFAGARRFRKAA
ncbi:PEP-CTERM sorting domain-containing protein [Hahella sp. NBU794]|uniref:PEP-CTERM sorting domain-containing protein n=1 Tax=Hahella sp. NBU794 TaxID=3422590 RepID=UPI003D6E828A